MKIICIGNRFIYPDNCAILLYEELKKLGINAIEGGIGGMNLITHFEDDDEYLIIDYCIGEKEILDKKDIEKLEIKEYNHANAFLYLLKTIKKEYKIFCCKGDTKEELKKILRLING